MDLAIQEQVDHCEESTSRPGRARVPISHTLLYLREYLPPKHTMPGRARPTQRVNGRPIWFSYQPFTSKAATQPHYCFERGRRAGVYDPAVE